jgi:hypothetical protein
MPDLVSLIRGHWCADDNGEEIKKFEWKALNIDHERVIFELDGPLDDLHSGKDVKTKFEVARYMRTTGPVLRVVAEKLNINYDETFFPSRLALGRQTRKQSAEEHKDIKVAKESFTCMTKGLLLIFAWFALARKCSGEKREACKIFAGFLRQVLSEDFDIDECVLSMLSEFACHCRAPPVAGSDCVHVQEFRRSMALWPDSGPQRTCEAVFQIFVFHSKGCPALKDLCVELFETIAEEIDAEILDGRFEVVARELRPRPNRKRRRIDEHFKHEVINDCLKHKKAKSGRAFLRVDGSADASVATKWEAEHMMHYLTASARGMKDVRQISLASDGARLGDPPEETLMTLAWTPQGGVGVVPPPQVTFHINLHPLSNMICSSGVQLEASLFPPVSLFQ